MQQQDKQQHSQVHVVPSHPTYYPVIQTPVIECVYKPQYTVTPVEFGAFHNDYAKAVMYGPSKSQVIAVGRES